MKSASIFLLLGLLGLAPLTAQEAVDTPYRKRIIVLPVASYSPETRLMFGGMLNYQFKPRGAGPETRASQLLASGLYTLNRQVLFEVMPIIILPRERWLLEGYYQYAFFPDNYWGVGPLTTSSDELDVEFRRLNFYQTVFRRMGPGLYAGPRLRYIRMSRIEFEDPEGLEVPLETINGVSGSALPGIGFSVRWDRRNSISAPTKNHFLELTALFYPKWLGASHPHQSWQVDARKYFDLRNDRKSVLAFHMRLRMAAGDIPFQEYSLIGGREIMRGYYEGRFRDANVAQVQVEFRQHLFWRFGAAVFLAGGEAWDQWGDITFENPKFAGGLGLRFNLNPEDTNNIRLDYGIGRHGGGFYFTIGEAF